jgi:hypothetical protein
MLANDQAARRRRRRPSASRPAPRRQIEAGSGVPMFTVTLSSSELVETPAVVTPLFQV